jgi:hypothetical protein
MVAREDRVNSGIEFRGRTMVLEAVLEMAVKSYPHYSPLSSRVG